MLGYLDYEFGARDQKKELLKLIQKGDGFILEKDTETEYYVQ